MQWVCGALTLSAASRLLATPLCAAANFGNQDDGEIFGYRGHWAAVAMEGGYFGGHLQRRIDLRDNPQLQIRSEHGQGERDILKFRNFRKITPAMTIEIHTPELEAMIMQRIKSGRFLTVEEVLLQALKTSPPASGAR